MTDLPSIHTAPPITLRGAWLGRVGDPARLFRGTVVHSDDPAVPLAGVAEVTFEVSPARVSSAAQHGTYVLTVGGRRLTLMSFTCRSEASSGSQGHDDTQEADWQVRPLPEKAGPASS